VFVHSPITRVTISKVAGQPATVSDSCLSRGAVHGPESWLFQANAFNGTTDITASVGPFSWQQIDAGSADIVSLSTPANGSQGCLLSPGQQCLNEETATASVPGINQIYATASGFSSQPISIETCRVQSISIAAAGDVPTDTSFLVNTGASTVLNATVTDIAGQTITGAPLTWSPSNPSSVSVSASAGTASTVYGSTETITTPAVGAGTVIASCTPPTCNAGIKPSLPIYPQAAISFQVENTTSAPATPTVYASTTACTDKFANPGGATCSPSLVPITTSSATTPFAAGTPTALPASPNTFAFGNSSSSGTAYLGVDSGQFGQQGLMVFNSSTVGEIRSAPGRVLAISPDQNSVIISDTVDLPNQVFVCDACSGSSPTVTALSISGATAAAFSPDSLKAYILAGSNLYVYSRVDPLQTIPLSGSAKDVAFHPEGGFAYLAGPSASISPYRVCDNSPISSATLASSNTPVLIRALPDGGTLLAVDPPNIDEISVTLPPLAPILCNGTLADTSSSFNLGQGSFIPTQFLVSPSGSTAYILGETQAGPPPARLPFIIVFNIATQTPSAVSLANNATPLSIALAPAGNLLFVGADDGNVHVIDTSSNLDTQQVTFPFPTNELCFGSGNPATQVPLSQISVSAASQNGSATTYTYALISGPPLRVGESITLTSMSDGGDNGTFTIASLGTDMSGNLTFTVSNSLGVTASGQSGAGMVPISCNPDLLAVQP
jgi:hypothetical protein